tara:strand:- start:25010 stop:26272 length:1263 start_codon:yes stop_codon:yes gene_type:complete
MARAVVLIVDGLRGDMVRPELTPNLAALAAASRHFPKHRGVFPSATRITSASISTGCLPGAHGLQGNAIAIDEGQGLQAVSVGPPEFRERWRAATGRTLHRPTLTQVLKDKGGAVIHTNSSAGAAHMQDPDGHGTLFHRSGSWRPGFEPVTGDEHPAVAYDAGGDAEVTRRFCDWLRDGPVSALNLLWICEPDHSQHVQELGSADHLENIAGADSRAGEVMAAVQGLRDRGEDVLFIAGSDHGHETARSVVPVTEMLVKQGFKESPVSSDVVLGSSGMGALLYFAPEALSRVDDIAAWLRAQAWCGDVFAGEELAAAGHRVDTPMQIAFSMAKSGEANRFGVPGLGDVCGDPFSPKDSTGFGQHGGLGPYETNPMLIVSGRGFATGVSDHQSSVTDIAPTVLRHLDVDGPAMDGSPLQGL